MKFKPIITCAALALGSASGFVHAEVNVSKNGEPLAVIVHNGHTKVASQIPDNPSGTGKGVIQPAVTELQNYLEQITGAKLPMVETLEEAGDKPAIILEIIDDDRLPQASEKDTGGHAYHLKTDGKRLHLRAANDLALHNAVYGLLEDHLDCGFYTYRFSRQGHGASRYEGPGYEVIPEQPTLAIGDLDDFQEPSFATRGLIFRMGGYPWILKNRGIGVGDHVSGALASGHTMYGYLPPTDKKVRRRQYHQEGLFEKHPEIYPLNLDGEREPDMWNMSLCGTAEALPELLANAIINERSEGAGSFVKIGQGDGFAPCHCDDCRQLVHEHQAESAPMIHMFNEALKIVEKTHPDLKVITFNYFGTLRAPKDMEVHPNLWINVVSSDMSANAAGDQMGPIANNPANREYARALREWPELAPGRVTVWHWDTYRAEWPSMFYVGENMKYMHEAGVYGVNPQTCGGPWFHLLNWLYMKTAWNVDADADELIEKYVNDVYGEAAAPHMWDYMKLGQKAYEDSLHVPSAVRWSGWTRLTMQKIFHAGARDKMVAAMDKAEAAARESDNPVYLKHVLESRDEAIDTVVWDAATRVGDWGRIEHDGESWFVPGADPHVAGVIQRRKAGRGLQSVSRFVRDKGGPVVDIAGDGYAAAIVPDLRGQVVSVVHRPSGKELLDNRDADAGYRDLLGGYHTQLWAPADANVDELAERRMHLWADFDKPRADRLKTDVILSPKKMQTGNRLRRNVQATPEGVLVERHYTGDPDARQAAGAHWRLAMPEPGRATLSVRGGGVREFMDLRYAEPGGIRLVQAGERPPGYEGLDAMDESWDAVTAVSDADPIELELSKDEGELKIQLQRGDGLETVLTTPAQGWKTVKLTPRVGDQRVDVELIGPDPQEGEAFELPVQTLAAREVERREPIERENGEEAKIRITGENTAINEADGAELVWVPEGTFIRGSDSDVAGGDEGPVREIYLDGYWVYKHPVSLGQFRAFVEETDREYKAPWGSADGEYQMDRTVDSAEYPVNTNSFDAEAYAKWVGGKLPTEAQWEKAARGTDGRTYPWGDEHDEEKYAGYHNTWLSFPEDRFTRGFYPADSFSQGASPYGALHMAGNTWEWTADWYDFNYYAQAPKHNPTGPETSNLKAVRGGSSMYDERFVRTTARMALPPQVDNWTPVGFRVVIHAPGPEGAGE